MSSGPSGGPSVASSISLLQPNAIICSPPLAMLRGHRVPLLPVRGQGLCHPQ
jgi:hypothetical protein